jgi:uncharacterized protein
MKYDVTSMLSENLHKTEDGFLICKNVPIARPGELVYKASELPSFEAEEGKITAVRDSADILSPDTIRSFEGKTVSYLHPKEQEINSKNWKNHAVGYTFNVRAGDGQNQNLLMADLLINDEAAIKAITERGLREVSLGYVALYKQEGKGRVRQSEIKGNHIALVPRGRCGALCAIQDHAAATKTEKSKMSLKDKLQAIIAKINDSDLDDDDEDKQQKSINKLQKTVDSLVASNAETAKALKTVVDSLAEITKDEETEEEKTARLAAEAKAKAEEDKKTSDAKTTDEAFLPAAEILCPGIKPSKDIKKEALRAAYKTEDGKVAIEVFTDGVEVDYTNDAEVSAVFLGASNLLKKQRNLKIAETKHVALDELSIHKPASMTPEMLNKTNDEFWNGKKGDK